MTEFPTLISAGGVVATAVAARHAAARSSRLRATRRFPTTVPPDSPAVVWLTAPRLVVRALDNAAIASPADIVWTLWMLVTVIGAAMVGLLVGAAPAALYLLIAFLGPVVALGARRGEARRRFDAGVPEAMEAVARSLRTGVSMRQAIEEAGDATAGRLGHELRRISTASSHGQPLVACLERFALRHDTSSVRLSVAALCLGIEAGGSQARAIDGVATTLRERLAVTAELQALSSQARISALVIGLAPIGFSGFAMLTDSRTADFLLRTPMGWAFVGAGVALDASGWLWMRRLCGARTER